LTNIKKIEICQKTAGGQMKKKRLLKNACFSLAFILFLGLLPGTALAEGNDSLAPTVDETIQGSASRPVLYTPRLTVPTTDNACFYADNTYYQGGYGMPNCTAYAWGRAYEILGQKPNLCSGNANQWWDYNQTTGAYPSGSTPKLGAVICWSGGSSGHVAVVEAINGNVVTASESAWSGPLFKTYTYTIGAEDATSVGGFQGYIYIGDFVDISSDVTPPSISDIRITDINEEGFTVSCEVSDDLAGVGQVFFPVWSDNLGQDDLIWHQGTITGNTASCRIAYADHNGELGNYTIHAYAYDRAGNSSTAATAVINEENGFRSLGEGAFYIAPETKNPEANQIDSPAVLEAQLYQPEL
jgi:surface antigen